MKLNRKIVKFDLIFLGKHEIFQNFKFVQNLNLMKLLLFQKVFLGPIVFSFYFLLLSKFIEHKVTFQSTSDSFS